VAEKEGKLEKHDSGGKRRRRRSAGEKVPVRGEKSISISREETNLKIENAQVVKERGEHAYQQSFFVYSVLKTKGVK